MRKENEENYHSYFFLGFFLACMCVMFEPEGKKNCTFFVIICLF